MKEIVIGEHLDIRHRNLFIELCLEFKDIFHKEGDPINKLNSHIKHKIRLIKGTKPIQTKAYSLPINQRQAIREKVKQ